MPDTEAGEVMTANPRCCTPEDTVDVAARVMALEGCGAVPVIDDADSRRVVGIVTDGDLVRRVVAKGFNATGCRVGHVMSPDPVTLTSLATVEECSRLMAERGIKRIPIVDDGGRIMGIVARSDLSGAAGVGDPAEQPDAGAAGTAAAA